MWVSVLVSHSYTFCLSGETDFGCFCAFSFDQQWGCSAVNGFSIEEGVYMCYSSETQA